MRLADVFRDASRKLLGEIGHNLPAALSLFSLQRLNPLSSDAFPLRWEPNPAQEIGRLFFSADDT